MKRLCVGQYVAVYELSRDLLCCQRSLVGAAARTQSCLSMYVVEGPACGATTIEQRYNGFVLERLKYQSRSPERGEFVKSHCRSHGLWSPGCLERRYDIIGMDTKEAVHTASLPAKLMVTRLMRRARWHPRRYGSPQEG